MSRECIELELDEETACALESLCGDEPLSECVTKILEGLVSIRQAAQTLASAVAQEIMRQIRAHAL